MAIVEISTTLRNAGSVGVQACIYGVECEVLDTRDPAKIRFELMGPDEKIGHVVAKSGSHVVSSYQPVG